MRHFRRRHDDCGAAAVEFALLFVFLFVPMTWGTMAAATAFSRQSNLTQSAREASRYGATYDIAASGTGGTGGTLTTWLALVEKAALQSVGNKNNVIGGFDKLCVALVARTSDGTLDTSNTAHKEYGDTTTHSGSSCPEVPTPNLGASSTVVQVVLTRDTEFFLVFTTHTVHLDANSLTPFEGKLS